MKKYKYNLLATLFLILALGAIVSMIYFMEVSSRSQMDFPTHRPIQKQTYTNPDYGFEVDYLKDYILVSDGTITNYFRTQGRSLARIEIPPDLYRNTNFGSANISFAVRPGTSPENCIYFDTGKSIVGEMDVVAQVSGTLAYTTEFDGAAAGTKYDTKLYHIPYNNNCYELSLNVGIANIGNYEPGAVTEVDEKEIWARLNFILQTFKFTK